MKTNYLHVVTYKGHNYPSRYLNNGLIVSTESLKRALSADNYGGESEQLYNLFVGFLPDLEITLQEKEFELKVIEYGFID